MPESGQGTLTTQLSALLKAVLTQVDSQGIRLVYVTDEGYHPSDYYHRVLKKMVDPRRPWRTLEWRRIVDYYHACQYVQQLAEAIFSAGLEAQNWAKEMRHVLQRKVGGVSRVLKSASGLRRGRGLCGTAKAYDQAYGYLKKRRQWMQYHSYRRQKLPIGSGITEVSQLYYPYTDNLNLSYYWLGWIIKPRHRCRQVAGSTGSREREFMSTPVLPPRL